MFTMKLAADPEKISRIRERNHLDERPFFAYACEENGAITASCVYRLHDMTPVIIAAESGEKADALLLDGIVRAVFQHLSMNGFEEVILDENIAPDSVKALEKMRFPIGKPVQIEEFFETVRNCGTKME